MNQLVVIGITVLLGACGKGKEPTKATDCKTEAEALAKLLADTPHEPTAFMPHAGVTLVSRSDLRVATVAPAPVIVMNSDVIIFQGQLTSIEELADRLRAVHERAKSDRIYLQLDQSTPWSKVVAAVDAAGTAGFTAPAFAFMTPHKLTPPPRSPVDDRLDKLQGDTEAANKAVELAKMAEDIIKPCPALQRAFSSVAEVESKADYLIDALAPALVECKCSIDLPSLRSLMWRVLAVDPAVQVIAFDATTRSETLSLPGSTTWADASKRLAPTTKGMKLVAE